MIVLKEDGAVGGRYVDGEETEEGGARVNEESLSEYAVGRVGGFSTTEDCGEGGPLNLFNSFPSLTLL